MAYLRCEFHSESLKMSTSFIVLIPEKAIPGDIPVLMLLHGLSDNCTSWTRYTSIERYAQEAHIAVIMPEVQRSFYTDMAHGPEYFKYITEELPQFCRRMFRFSGARELNYIMGLSMGGYGALKAALNFPDRYAGCAAFSAVTDLQSRIDKADPKQQREFAAVAGFNLKLPMSGNLMYLAGMSKSERMPRFFLTCGEEDGLYSDSVKLAERMELLGADIEFRHWSGKHDWQFWDESVSMAIDKLITRK